MLLPKKGPAVAEPYLVRESGIARQPGLSSSYYFLLNGGSSALLGGWWLHLDVLRAETTR